MLKHAVTNRSSSSLGTISSSPESILSLPSDTSSPQSYLPYSPHSQSKPCFSPGRRTSLSSAELGSCHSRFAFRRTNSTDSYSIPINIYPCNHSMLDSNQQISSSSLNKSQGANLKAEEFERTDRNDSQSSSQISSVPISGHSDHRRNKKTSFECQLQSSVPPDYCELSPSKVERINAQDCHPDYHPRCISLNKLDYESSGQNIYNFQRPLYYSQYPGKSRMNEKCRNSTSAQNPCGNSSIYSTPIPRSRTIFHQHSTHNLRECGLTKSINNKLNDINQSQIRKISVPYPKTNNYQRKYSVPHLSSYNTKTLNFSSSIDEKSMSRSCTLPRRDTMLNNDIPRGSLRSNGSSFNFLSSGSCSSLTDPAHLRTKSASTTSLSDTVPVKIYLRRLRPDMEYKTVPLSLKTTCNELILLLLTKFRLRHRDPNLFFVLMEVAVRAPSDGDPVKRQLVLDDDARPAELQQCRPKGEANFSIGVKRGGLVRVHDSILMPGSQYKSLLVAYETTSEELVQLMLKCYNSLENPRNYALHELCRNPYKDRLLNPGDCPLKVQWEWPKNDRHNWAFILRRNLAFAFSLKSRMTWRRSLEHCSTDTESEYDDPSESLQSISLSSSPSSVVELRSSSISSSSSVSSSCSSRSSDKSLDSGYIGSPFVNGGRIQIRNSSEPSLGKAKEEKPQMMVIQESSPPLPARTTFPITASVSKLSLNSTLPSIVGTPTPSSASTPTNVLDKIVQKSRQKTVIKITSTIRTPPAPPKRNTVELYRCTLKPSKTPTTLKTTFRPVNIQSFTCQENNDSGEERPTLHLQSTLKSELIPIAPNTKHVSFTQRRALSLPPLLGTTNGKIERQNYSPVTSLHKQRLSEYFKNNSASDIPDSSKITEKSNSCTDDPPQQNLHSSKIDVTQSLGSAVEEKNSRMSDDVFKDKVVESTLNSSAERDNRLLDAIETLNSLSEICLQEVEKLEVTPLKMENQTASTECKGDL